MIKKLPTVFIVCSGLGHVNRGFESFTKECFEALKDNNQFNLYLFKGAGKKAAKDKSLLILKRSSFLAKALGKVLNSNSYVIEQFTFCLSLFSLIIKKKPAVIYYSDCDTGVYLWRFRKFFQLNYKLLFSNGMPKIAPYTIEDHIQQLVPEYLNDAIMKGVCNSKQTLLPYGFNINVSERAFKITQKKELKTLLSIEDKYKIILSVGAVNKRHKRMDYVIDEVSRLKDNFFLIILGQFEKETLEIQKLANLKLKDRCIIKNISHKEVEDYYAIADCFVLASLREGLPRVSVEALSFGLPCIVHDYSVTRDIFKQYGIYINMKLNGELFKCLSNNQTSFLSRQELIQAAYNMYSWDILKKDYIEMISKLIKN